ncbi:globin family protein [Deefgea salmonis]|uniref:Globin domain-containing protein n=1 Tax=Deefgea salmonis TaxID=2875502 RepID=A0ABS8BMY2_9NEIS|nr:globin family protein [Deefgea salmonis]MCB5197094.1 globin domain-containing protein [Deefgea salmonis]
MSLTPKQIHLVQDSFAKVEPIADQAAVIFYQQLFAIDPSLQNMFKHDMKAQGKMLMSTLKLAVGSLNNLPKLIPVLEKLAVRHLDYGVKNEHYTLVGNALLRTLKIGLGDAFNDETREAWSATYRLMAKVMKTATV